MHTISKFEKELERREITNAGFKRKVMENYARAFMNLFQIEGFLFGLVDARRDQALEDTVQMLVEQIGELGLEKLTFSTDLNEAKRELNELIKDRDAVLTKLEPFIKNLNNELEEQKKSLNYIEKKVSSLGKIEKDIKEILKVFQDPRELSTSQSTDYVATTEPETDTAGELLVKLGDMLINNVSSMIKMGELNSALKIIDGAIETANFEVLGTEQKLDLLSIRGDILVKKGKKKEAKKILDRLLAYNGQTKRMVDFLHFYSSVYQDKKLLDLALNFYKELGCKTEEVELKTQYYLLVSGKFDAVIQNLTQ